MNRGEWILNQSVSGFEQVGAIIPTTEYRVCIENIE